jgi:hypothetical protein
MDQAISYPQKQSYNLKVPIHFSMNKLSLVRLYTFPAPEQFGHLFVVGTRKGRSEAVDTERGSMLRHTPLVEHRAQAK